jgi:formylglycine-generating enzyme required for sulfatase activity/serine/threonine protein kinase
MNMPVYIGSSGKTYSTPDQPFAGGGEGSVFVITGDSGLVAKIYDEDKRITGRERKLSAMVVIKPGLIDQYAWPLDVVYERGKFAGYIMPKVTDKEKLRNIYVYDNRGSVPWTLYAAIAKNLAAAIHNVHEIGQVIGDLNPENILVDPHTGLVTLVDTDSYHITDAGGEVHRCVVGMPEFIAPELQGLHFPSAPLPTFTRESDLFALSILIFALLMNGAHPYACKTISGSSSKFQPIDNMVSGICAYFAETSTANLDIPRYAPDLNSLPDGIQSLFHRGFVEGHKAPDRRPSAEEWYYALEKLEQNIKVCGINREHLYYSGAAKCPWCGVEAKMRTLSQTTFTGSASTVSGQGAASRSSSSGPQPLPAAQAVPVSPPVQPKKRNRAAAVIVSLAGIAALLLLIYSRINYGTLVVTVQESGQLYIDGMALGNIFPGTNEFSHIDIGYREAAIEYENYGETEIKTVEVRRLFSTKMEFDFRSFMVNTIGMKLQFIPRGSFVMGSPANEAGSDERQHQVSIERGFFMGRYEVTQGEYKTISGANPSSFGGNDRPVETVSWLEAVWFCNRLSEREGLAPAYYIGGNSYRDVQWVSGANGYRLPSEAEWEYACRAGTQTRYYWGDTIYPGDAEFNSQQTAPAGFYGNQNAWNLYDMHGNVREWCWDDYQPNYLSSSGGYYMYLAEGGVDPNYSGGIPRGGQGIPRFQPPSQPDYSDTKVNRGGSWNDNPWNLRSAFRGASKPEGRYNTIGFRVVRSR